jgi:hypothetical protein
LVEIRSARIEWNRIESNRIDLDAEMQAGFVAAHLNPVYVGGLVNARKNLAGARSPPLADDPFPTSDTHWESEPYTIPHEFAGY